MKMVYFQGFQYPEISHLLKFANFEISGNVTFTDIFTIWKYHISQIENLKRQDI